MFHASCNACHWNSHSVSPPESLSGLACPHIRRTCAVSLEHHVRGPAGEPLEVALLATG